MVPEDGIGEDYYRQAYPIIEQRLQQGGVRLAEIVNRIAAGSAASQNVAE